MIYDNLPNSGLYPQNELFRKAFEFLKTLNANTPCGKTVLSDDDLFVSIDEYETKPRENAKPESHRNYIDIQVLLSGEEQIDIFSAPDLTTAVPYDPERDLEFYEQPSKPDAVLTMKPGRFAVFFPDDAHTPCLQADGTAVSVKKAVAKIRT